jgi:hypothetical protein
MGLIEGWRYRWRIVAFSSWVNSRSPDVTSLRSCACRLKRVSSTDNLTGVLNTNTFIGLSGTAADLEDLGGSPVALHSCNPPLTKVSSIAPPASAAVSGFLLDTGLGLEY